MNIIKKKKVLCKKVEAANLNQCIIRIYGVLMLTL